MPNKKKVTYIDRPRVGVAVFIDRRAPHSKVFPKEMQILIGLRKGKHGDSSWALPGGNLEAGETWKQCARREVKEETGLTVSGLDFVGLTNDLFPEQGLHYVTIFLHATSWSGRVRNREPEKCSELRWNHVSQLPTPLFTPLDNCLKQWDSMLTELRRT